MCVHVTHRSHDTYTLHPRVAQRALTSTEFLCPHRGEKKSKKKNEVRHIDRTDCCNWRNAVVSSARTDNSVHTIRP